jgi:hypothetical protein
MLNDAVEKAVEARLASFVLMFAGEKWMAVQKGAPEAVAFMRAEADRLETAATTLAAAARTRGRRAVDAARSVSSALANVGIAVPDGLREAAEGRSMSPEVAEQHVAAAIALIPAERLDATSMTAQADFAVRLGAGEEPRALSVWLAARKVEPTVTEQRLDRLLAELDILTDGADDFARRADGVMRESDPSRRALLTDSLVMDVAAHVSNLRRREAGLIRMRDAAVSLAPLMSPGAITLRAQLLANLEEENIEAEGALVAEAAAIVQDEIRVTAAAARRRAVLSGLASLGYEVRETMTSIWERDGRIVVRKPGMNDYGVELGAPADVARLQVRLVGSDQPRVPRDSRRDADQETIWCSEFDRLKVELAAVGNEIVIEKALVPGEQKLKSIYMPEATCAQDIEFMADVAARRLS